MLKKLKKIMALLLIAALLIGTNAYVNVNAAQENNSLTWDVNDISLNHKNISFILSDVENAQDATVVLIDNDSNEVVFEKTFSISSASQKINLNVTDGYLSAGSYYLYIQNSSGEKTNNFPAYVTNHSHWFSMTGNAYPNCFEGQLSWSSTKGMALKLTANIGFKDYEGIIDEDGNAKLEYPVQEVGTIINFKVYDDFGCEYTFDKTVKDVAFSDNDLKAWYTGISIPAYARLDKTERICAEVDGTIYFSEYGAASASTMEESMILTYPSTTADTITYWYESQYGSRSEEKTLQINSCELYNCEYNTNAYQFKATGTVQANSKDQKPTKVKVTLGEKEYSTNITEDGTFSLSYPSQQDYAELELLFEDEHGCSYGLKESVYNDLAYTSPEIDDEYVLPTKTTITNIRKDVRLVAQIGKNKYYGDYGKNTITYPHQTPGTVIKFWLESTNSCLSSTQTAKVFSGEYEININARTGSAKGDIYSTVYSSGFNSTIKSAYAIIAGKKYNCTIEKKKDDMDDIYYHFTANYPIQKIGTTITFCFTDANQISFYRKVTLTNIAPKIHLNKVDSSCRKVTGTTTAKSNVTIKIGKKNYKCKANASGRFSAKIKVQKKGTKIAVSVTTPEGYTNTCSTKVKQATGTLFITNYIYKSSKRIKIKLTNAKKGDKVKVVAGSKFYTKKITSNKKTQKITIKIKKMAAGKYVKATLYDKFSKKKDSEKTMVYYGDSIYKGMSATNAQLTTWGYPDRKNDYGFGYVQWVYESGNTILYVYIKGGKVTNIQRINY